MSGNETFPVHHIGGSVSAQVNAADHVVKCVIFVNSYYIEGCLLILLHRHSHGDAELSVKNSGRAGGQIVCFFQKSEEVILQILRCTVDSLYQPALQVIQGNGMQLVDLSGFHKHFFAVFADYGGIKPSIICSCRTHA